MHNKRRLSGVIMSLILVLTLLGTGFCCDVFSIPVAAAYAKTEPQTPSSRSQTLQSGTDDAAGQTQNSVSQDGDASLPEEDTDIKTPERPDTVETSDNSDSDTAEKLTQREIVAKPSKVVRQVTDKNGNSQYTTEYRYIQTFWKSHAGHTGTLHKNSRTLKDTEAPFELTVSGRLPEDVRAEVSYLQFDEGNTYTENALFAIDLTLLDRNGNVYIPEDPVTVTVSSADFEAAIDDGEAFLVYAYEENADREDEYDGKYAADVLVYKDEVINDKLLSYKVYDNNRKYKDGEDAVRYVEDEDGLAVDEDESSASFEYVFGQNADAAHFMLSSQAAERTLKATSGSNVITVEGALRKNVKLEVREITERNKAYDDYVGQAADTVGTDEENVSFARAFDIKIIDEDTGKEFQPDSDVKVSIGLKDEKLSTGDDTNIDVVHFQGSGTNDAEVMDSSVSGKTVEFSTEGFSVYVVVGYTVDFHWGEYTYSIEGESNIWLSSLLNELAKSEKDDAAQLKDLAGDMSRIKDVSFSDPKLVKVEKKSSKTSDSDWLLTSLKAFDTEETLTIGLTDGSRITVKVTDDLRPSEAEGTFKVINRSNGQPGQQEITYWDTFAEAAAKINGGSNFPATIEVLDLKENGSYEISNTISFTRAQELTIIGHGHTLVRSKEFKEDLISRTVNSAWNISDMTIDNGNVSASGKNIIKGATGALNLTNVTIYGGRSKGTPISDKGTGELIITGCTINGPSVATTNPLIFKSANGAVTISGTTVNGGKSTGSMLTKTGTGAGVIYITGSVFNGGNNIETLIKNAGTGNVTLTNTNVNRNDSTSAGIENTRNGALTIEGCTFSGSGNERATAPLIKTGTGSLTFKDTTVKEHTVNASDICAVDANSASGITIDGNTVIKGNTSNGQNANLKIRSNKAKIATTFTGEIGISGATAAGIEFATRDRDLSVKYSGIKNDFDDTVTAVAGDRTHIKWSGYTNKPFQLIDEKGTPDDRTDDVLLDYYDTLTDAVKRINSEKGSHYRIEAVNQTVVVTGSHNQSVSDVLRKNVNILLTTAPEDQSRTKGHIYQGKPGTVATLYRGVVSTHGFMEIGHDGGSYSNVHITVENIILDGDRDLNYTTGYNTRGGLLYIDNGADNAVITVGKGAILRNSRVTDHAGALDCHGNNADFVIKDGARIENNYAAAEGSAIMVHSGGRVTLENCIITGNVANSGHGAIECNDGQRMDIRVSGSAKVYNNYDTSGNEANVFLKNKAKDEFRVVGNLDEEALIGVNTKYWYEAGDVFGIAKEADGTTDKTASEYTGYNRIKNDRNDCVASYGDGSEVKWYPVCKIGSNLYSSLKQAIEGRPRTTDHPALNGANSMSGSVKIEMLIDEHKMREQATLNTNASSVTVTTASPNDASYPYIGQAEQASVFRYYQENSMIAVSKGNLTLNKITMDGNMDGTIIDETGQTVKAEFTGGNGSIISMNSAYALTLGEDAILQNGRSAGNGGAVYLKSGSTLNIRDKAELSGSEAVNGGAVYVDNNATMNMSGGTITDNISSEGGAVNMGGTGSRLNFSGKPKVTDNGSRNVFLDLDSNLIINDTGLTGGQIGVYVKDGESLFDKHGKEDLPFGTIGSGASNKQSAFINDRLAIAGEKQSDGLIHWGAIIARVSVDGGDWVTFGYLISNGEKEGAFNYANSQSGEVIIETLKETHERYTLTNDFTFNNSGMTSLTLRTTDDEEWNPDGFRSILVKNHTRSMITSSFNGEIITKDIILDGGSENGITTNSDGGLVHVTNGEIAVRGGTTMQNVSMSSHDGGAIYTDNNIPVTIETAQDETVLFKSCTARNGGAVYVKKGNIGITSRNMTDPVSFESCRSANDGGAIYQNGGESLTMTNVAFGKETDADSGCQAAGEGGAINTSISGTLTNCAFYHCMTTSSTSGGGGAIFYSGGRHEIRGCIFSYCEAAGDSKGQGNGGAIKLDKGSALIIDRSDARRSNFSNCTANRYGGAIEYEPEETGELSITDTDFSSCIVNNIDGGAVASDAKILNISGCTFDKCKAEKGNGGAIADGLDGGAKPTMTMENTSISECSAKSGAAVYIRYGPGAVIKQSGTGICEIESCAASDASGGAVNLAAGRKVSFEGNVVINNNISTKSGNMVQANVVLDQNNNTTINTTDTGLGAKARIGVYVTGDMTGNEKEPYKSHGGYEDDFATHGTSTDNLDAFTNDRNGFIGEACPVRGHGTLIRWTSYLCKVTDSSGHLLYERTGSEEEGYTYHPAVYKFLKTQSDGTNIGGFDAAQGELYRYGGQIFDDDSVQVHVLKNYTQPSTDQPNNTGNRAVTFTTANTNAALNPGYDKGDIYIYTRGSDTAHTEAERATITRGEDGSSMFVVSGSGNLITKKLIIDGGNKAETPLSCSESGGIFSITAGILDVNDNTTLRNSTAVNGGAILTSGTATLAMNSTEIVNCIAAHTTTQGETGRGGSIYHTSSTQALITDCIIDGGSSSEETVLNAYIGGAIYLSSGKLKITGSEIKNCETYTDITTNHGGGAIYSNSNDTSGTDETVIIDNTTIRSCASRDGGGIYMNNKGSLLMRNNSKIQDCTVFNKGGGIYTTGAATVRGSMISGCKTTNVNTEGSGEKYTNALGGGIYQKENRTVTIDNSTISGNKCSYRGGGIYTKGNLVLKNGSSVTGNSLLSVSTDPTNAAGIFIEDGRTLTLGDGTQTAETSSVTGNTMADGTTASNVRLSQSGNVNSSNSVFIMSMLDAECKISVANASDFGTWFCSIDNKDGLRGMSVLDLNNEDFVKIFEADDGILFGCIDPDDDTQTKVHWIGGICKITDESGKLLKYNGVDAVFANLKVAFETFKTATFTYADGTSGNPEPYYIKMLVEDYTVNASGVIPNSAFNSSRPVVLTTEQLVENIPYPYTGSYSDKDELKRSTLIKAANNTSMLFNVGAGGDLTVTNLIIDGRNSNISKDYDAGLIYVSGNLTLTDGAELKNGKAQQSSNARAGAVYVANGGKMFMEDADPDNPPEIPARIHDCIGRSAGAVYVGNGGELTLDGHAQIYSCESRKPVGASFGGSGGAVTVGREKTAGTIIQKGNSIISNCKAGDKGGAVYIEYGTYDLTENAKIMGCTAATGAGIYLEGNANNSLTISGSPTFGDGSTANPANTVVMSGYSGKKNGNKEVYTDGKVRQDIFIAGYENKDAPTVKVTGKITSGNGSIWVWAEKTPHYLKDKQFAVFAGGGISLSAADKESSVRSFRNARSDDETGNTSMTYLTGIVATTGNNINWGIVVNGSRKVILKKTDKDNAPLTGAEMTIHTVPNAADEGYTWVDPKNPDNSMLLANLTSTSSGIFWVGILPYGTYYIEETTAPSNHTANAGTWYYLIVDEKGVFAGGGENDRGSKDLERIKADATAKNAELSGT